MILESSILEKENVKHLLDILKEFYDVEEDWEGALYCGITLKWNCKEFYIDILMPNYIHKQLLHYKRPPKWSRYCPYELKPIHYGKKSDEIVSEKESLKLNNKDKKYIQCVMGSFLIYAHAIDLTILVTLSSDIAVQQANPTKQTMQWVNLLLAYMHTNPNVVIWFKASDMILNVHSNVSYLSAAACGWSCAGGYFFLGSLPQDRQPSFLNGNIQITSAILKLVYSSAAEAELGALSQHTRSYNHSSNSLQIRPSSTAHTNPHRHYYNCQNYEWHYQSTTTMLHEYEIFLVTWWQITIVCSNLSKEHLHMPTSPTHLAHDLKTRAQWGCAEILGDP